MSPPTEPVPGPAVLLTLLTGQREDVDLVRRRIGYRKLILLPHPGTEPLAHAVHAEEGEANAHVEPLGPGDTLAHLQTLRRTVKRETRSTRTRRVVLNAAGGDPEHVLAMLLLAYEEGHETWFIQEGRHEKLPILKGVTIQNRLGGDEETILRSLPKDGTTSSDLAQKIILPRPRIETAYRSLEKKDLVELYPHHARLAARPTPTGRYLQDYLNNPPGRRNEA